MDKKETILKTLKELYISLYTNKIKTDFYAQVKQQIETSYQSILYDESNQIDLDQVMSHFFYQLHTLELKHLTVLSPKEQAIIAPLRANYSFKNEDSRELAIANICLGL